MRILHLKVSLWQAPGKTWWGPRGRIPRRATSAPWEPTSCFRVTAPGHLFPRITVNSEIDPSLHLNSIWLWVVEGRCGPRGYFGSIFSFSVKSACAPRNAGVSWFPFPPTDVGFLRRTSRRKELLYIYKSRFRWVCFFFIHTITCVFRSWECLLPWPERSWLSWGLPSGEWPAMLMHPSSQWPPHIVLFLI